MALTIAGQRVPLFDLPTPRRDLQSGDRGILPHFSFPRITAARWGLIDDGQEWPP
jgi:hypothetical protein